MAHLSRASVRNAHGILVLCSAMYAMNLFVSFPATAQAPQTPEQKKEEELKKQRQQQRKGNEPPKGQQQQAAPPPGQKPFLPPRGERPSQPPPVKQVTPQPPAPPVKQVAPTPPPGQQQAPAAFQRKGPPPGPPSADAARKGPPEEGPPGESERRRRPTFSPQDKSQSATPPGQPTDPNFRGRRQAPGGQQPAAGPQAPAGQQPAAAGQTAPAGAPVAAPRVAPQPGTTQPGSIQQVPGTPPAARIAPQGPATPGAAGLPAAMGQPSPGNVVRPIAGPKQLEQVKRGRVQTVGKGGQTIIQEPGNRIIIKQDNRTFITRNETTTIKTFVPSARTTRLSGGVTQTSFVRPGGARVFSETDSSGRLLRRYRRDSSGREIMLIDNRRFYRNLAIGVGAGLLVGAAIVALAPPVHALPRERYIVEYVHASDDDIYEALVAPPVERLERVYSLEEIRYSEPLRARMRRIDLDSINFEFGSFEVTPDQYGKLERIARAMGRAIDANPAEVFLIEGHTDAVGSTEDNLSLSDRRAESVARILSEHYNIPIENLVTQGYGEQFLKVPTQEAERANRRVSTRRITPLLSQEGGGRN